MRLQCKWFSLFCLVPTQSLSSSVGRSVHCACFGCFERLIHSHCYPCRSLYLLLGSWRRTGPASLLITLSGSALECTEPLRSVRANAYIRAGIVHLIPMVTCRMAILAKMWYRYIISSCLASTVLATHSCILSGLRSFFGNVSMLGG